MWKRDSWHACAAELDEVSLQFRNAYWGRTHSGSWPRTSEDEQMMEEASREGVKIMRSLALAVRSEQDFSLVPPVQGVVGITRVVGESKIDTTMLKQRSGFHGLKSDPNYKSIGLRECLNKIAHAEPSTADFYVGAGNSDHDLILQGVQRSERWLAIVSIIELISVVRQLPDCLIRQT